MSLLKRFLFAPATYAVWTGLVIAAVVATYYVDPYVFGFTTLILGWISAVPVVAGTGVAVFAKQLAVSARTMIALSVVINAATVSAALVLLRGFKWA